MLSMNELKLGTVVTINSQPYVVSFTQHIKMGRGSATLRTKLKNLITGATLEKSFSSGEKVESADVARRQTRFLYLSSGTGFFMDQESFEQYELPEDTFGDMKNYLTPEQDVDVLLFNGRPVSIELPKKVTLKVTVAPPGVKGDSASSPTKTVTMETGLEIRVPLFIKEGDILRLNTETDEYVERAN